MCHCLRSTWSARAEGQASQWWATARAPLAQHDVLARVLQSPSALDSSCLIRTLSVFDGVVISIKNSSWRTADAPTLNESCQSVVYLTSSDAYASRRRLLGCSASECSAFALTINLQQCCLPEHCAWCVSICAYSQIAMTPTLCLSALCWHDKHACAPMWVRGMGCQQVICKHCYCQRTFQLLFGTRRPFLTGEPVIKRDGEQVGKVDIVRARMVGRMGHRQGRRQRVKGGMSDDG